MRADRILHFTGGIHIWQRLPEQRPSGRRPATAGAPRVDPHAILTQIKSVVRHFPNVQAHSANSRRAGPSLSPNTRPPHILAHFASWRTHLARPSSPPRMPKVFISHSSQDRSRIESDVLSLLRSHGIEYWYSSENIPSASDWEKVIRRALGECDWFLAALSAHALQSDWVQAEVHWALDHRKDHFVSLLLDDCTPSDLHLKLIRYQHVDFRQNTDEGCRRLIEALGQTYQNIPQLRLDYVLSSAPEQVRRLVISDSVFIGRANDCAICAPSHLVSRRHAVFYVKTQGAQRSLWLSDLNSTNGTTLNGARLQTAAEIKVGDRIDFGRYPIEVVAITPA